MKLQPMSPIPTNSRLQNPALRHLDNKNFYISNPKPITPKPQHITISPCTKHVIRRCSTHATAVRNTYRDIPYIQRCTTHTIIRSTHCFAPNLLPRHATSAHLCPTNPQGPHLDPSAALHCQREQVPRQPVLPTQPRAVSRLFRQIVHLYCLLHRLLCLQYPGQVECCCRVLRGQHVFRCLVHATQLAQ